MIKKGLIVVYLRRDEKKYVKRLIFRRQDLLVT